MAQPSRAVFGDLGQGIQVGENSGSISVTALFNAAPETPPQPFPMIPFSRDPDFVNRGDIIDRVYQRFAESPRRVALVGLGGVGKSQLAIHFAHQMAAGGGTWVFWIHAETRARVDEGFRTIAEAVRLPGRREPKANIPQLVFGWLSNVQNGRWVMVLDSADDRDVFYGTDGSTPGGRPLATYLPQSENGSIIVTTRNKELAFKLAGYQRNVIEIGPMTEQDAFLLLENRLGSLSDNDTAMELVRTLELIPLAISQAAAYIQQRAPRTSVEKYLAEFREGERKRARLLDHDSGDIRRDGGASNSILTTWTLSFERIRSERPTAADLLSLMSFFDRQGIPEKLIEKSRQAIVEVKSPVIKEPDSGDENDHPGNVTQHSNTEDDSDGESDTGFEDDLAMLRDYCLVTVNGTGDLFEMHGLVQLSTRRWLEARGLAEIFKLAFLAIMARTFPTAETEEAENSAICQGLFAHVEAAIEYPPTSDEAQEAWATLLYDGAYYAFHTGSYCVAERMFSESRAIRERTLGVEAEDTLASTVWFVQVLAHRGQLGDAEKLQLQALETLKKKLGLHHDLTLTSMRSLVRMYENQGRWEEFEVLQRQIVEVYKSALGADYTQTLAALADLASVYAERGLHEEAKELRFKELEAHRSHFGADHLQTFHSMARLADAYWWQGQAEEAQNLLSEVLGVYQTHFGPDHPNTITIIGNLAVALYAQDKLEEAQTLQLQVVENKKAKLGIDHQETLLAMHNLACIWKDQGRHTNALSLMMECVELRKKVIGPQHPHTLMALEFFNKWSCQGMTAESQG